MPGTIIAGALGNCVHVAGVVEFLRIAKEAGYNTVFLGAAVSVPDFAAAVEKYDPDIVGVSYRLTPDVGEQLVWELRAKLEQKGMASRRFAFGGTPPVCEEVDKLGWFERSFNGLENPDAVWSYLRGCAETQVSGGFGHNLLERLERKHPQPLLRHHFGLPGLEDTISGVEKIARSEVLDIISIAPDQNAQETFFRPEEMDSRLNGAGGVPVRCAADMSAIYRAGRHGNHPLMRVYSGTRDLIAWAQMASKTISNAWAAVPLCWYSALDGRSTRSPEDAIRENQACMRWHALRDIPVEVNEAHHWSLRGAHDTVSVVMSYLAAYNARAMGVRHYVAQYMFNTPPGTHGAMDLAKILAQIEMVESLHGSEFMSFRQVRAGLLHLSPNLDVAKGQLAASAVLALAVRPHIVHVVGFCEGDHAASADDVIESCKIVSGVLRNCLTGMPNMVLDAQVQARKAELLAEAEVLLQAIRNSGDGAEDPLTSPRVIASAIRRGVLDAPHLKGNMHASGQLDTRVIDGAVYAVDPSGSYKLSEKERLAALEPVGAGYGAFPRRSMSCHTAARQHTGDEIGRNPGVPTRMIGRFRCG